MADNSTTSYGASGTGRRYSEPVLLGAIVPGVCAKIQARCRRAGRRLRQQRGAPARPARLAG